MTRPKVFITRKIFPVALDRISQAADIEVWHDDLPPSYEEMLERTRAADGLLTMLSDKIDCPSDRKITAAESDQQYGSRSR